MLVTNIRLKNTIMRTSTQISARLSSRIRIRLYRGRNNVQLRIGNLLDGGLCTRLSEFGMKIDRLYRGIATRLNIDVVR